MAHLSAVRSAVRKHPAVVLKTYDYSRLKDLMVATDLIELQQTAAQARPAPSTRASRRQPQHHSDHDRPVLLASAPNVWTVSSTAGLSSFIVDRTDGCDSPTSVRYGQQRDTGRTRRAQR